jgi:hypothetical protein
LVGSRSDRGLPRVVAAAVALLLSLGAAGARGDNPVAYKRGRFYEGKDLRVSVGFREMFDEGMKKRLKSGFATTVVMRVYLYRKRDGAPVAFAVRTLRAYYDPWDEEYLVKIRDHRGRSSRRFRDQRAVIDRLTSLWRFPIARVEQITQGTKYFVAVIAEVNPVDERLLAEVRRWLRNPHGGHRQVGGESFFGSFVSIFVNNKIRRAEKTFRVKTQPFYRR